MKTALFHNFTDKPFTGYWDGKGKTFKPGQKVYMPQYLAEHYAKHLANKILIEREEYTATSPKVPAQVPKFMELFNKACIVEEDAEEQTTEEMAIDLANRPQPTQRVATAVDSKEPQIITPPDADEDDEEFEGLKSEAPEQPAA